MSDQRCQLLVAALGFAGLPRPSYDRALWALRFWLNSWRGIEGRPPALLVVPRELEIEPLARQAKGSLASTRYSIT